MTQSKRILIAVLAIALIGGIVLGIDWLRRRTPAAPVTIETPPAAGTPAALVDPSAAPAGTSTPQLGADAIASGAPASGPFAATPGGVDRIVAGGIPIYFQGSLFAAFTPAELENLTEVSFVDPVENKPQTGWLVSEILLLYFTPDQLTPETPVTFISESREKSATLTWADISDPEGFVMFDVSNRGTLKLVSKMEKLDEREEWVQDTEKIQVGP